MPDGRARLSASILDADLSNLSREVRRAIKAGADRIHLDVMDGHFVPNITFGPGTIKRLRRITKLPFDAHLMISEPSRYAQQFIDAGCDSVTFHVEVGEPIEPTLRLIRKNRRAAGLALKPETPLTALEPYRNLLDIVMVMTVEPGFGGQEFMKPAARKILPARQLFRERAFGGEIHVDGGVNRENAEFCGGLGVDVLVVGSTLWKKGHDIGKEIRLVKALADEGYAYRLNKGKKPEPRDKLVSFASLPRAVARKLAGEIELEGIEVVQLRGDGRIEANGEQDFELLIPAAAEPVARQLFSESRARAEEEAEVWRRALLRDVDGTAGPGAAAEDSATAAPLRDGQAHAASRSRP